MSSIPSIPSGAASARKGSGKVSEVSDVIASTNEDDDYENELPPMSRGGPAISSGVRGGEDGDYESNATSDTDETEASSDEDDGSEINSDNDDDDDMSSVDAAADGGKVKDDGDGEGDDSSEDEKKPKKKRGAASRSKKNPEDDDLTLLGVPHGIFGDDDDNDDESGDSDADADRDSSEYFQKLSSTIRESYVETYHPESMSHNYDEIQTLARVVRNADGVIVDDLHRTIPIMTKYEKTRILGQRAKQLNEGAPAFIKIDSTVIDGYLIAVKELEQKKTPFIIRRPLPNGGSEYWRVQDLEIL